MTAVLSLQVSPSAAPNPREVAARLTGRGGPFEILRDETGRPLSFAAVPHSWADICRRALNAPDRPFCGPEPDLSTRSMVRQALALAKALQADGCGRGERIGLGAANGPAWIIGFLGIMLSGSVATLLPLSEDEELTALLAAKCGLRALVCDAGFRYGRFEKTLATVRRLDHLPDGDPRWTSSDIDPIIPDAEALIAFTSGSTGLPKAALFTHAASVAALKGMILSAAIAARTRPRPPGTVASGPSKTLIASHLSHVSGYAQIGLALMIGGQIVVTPQTSDMALVDLLRHEQATSVTGLPVSAIKALVRSATYSPFPALRAVGFHGAAIDERLREELNAVCTPAQVVTGYGLTETGGGIAVADQSDTDEAGQLGRPTPCVEAEVRNDAGDALAPGEAGRLWLRGASLMQGYLGEPPLSTVDGWHDTGDVAYLDEAGRIFLHARADEAFGAQWTICAHRAAKLVQAQAWVDEAAAVLVSDGSGAPTIYIFVTVALGAVAGPLEEAGPELANCSLHVVDIMPRTAAGKVDMARLKQYGGRANATPG